MKKSVIMLKCILIGDSMVRLFAKTMQDNRLKSTYKCAFNEDFNIEHFDFYVKTICEKFDSPSPVVLTKHIRDYIMFGTVVFRPDDFVESVHFDKLIIENNKPV